MTTRIYTTDIIWMMKIIFKFDLLPRSGIILLLFFFGRTFIVGCFENVKNFKHLWQIIFYFNERRTTTVKLSRRHVVQVKHFFFFNYFEWSTGCFLSETLTKLAKLGCMRIVINRLSTEETKFSVRLDGVSYQLFNGFFCVC